MKTVSLITLHRSANYGSVLQAYATQRVLEYMGLKVTVLDYYPERNSIKSMLRGLKHKTALLEHNPFALAVARAIILPSYIIRRRVFDRYVKHNLNLSELTFHSEAELRGGAPSSDIYITGSDQVWNSTWNGGIDEPLFLSFTPDEACRLALSASFGKESISSSEVPRTRELLSRYDYITVREDTGVRLVESLGLRATQVLDPTLFLSGDEWQKVCAPEYPEGDYILMYNINHNKSLDHFVEGLSKKTGLPVYYISYQLHDCVKQGHMRCCVPVEHFLSLIKNARFVACDSFHCTAFSVNFNKEFAIVLPDRFGTRLTSFMRVVGLEDRIVGERDIDVFDRPIEWKRVNRRLEEERARSFDAVKRMISRD